MDNKKIAIISLLVLILISVSAIFLISTSNPNLSPDKIDLEKCKILQNNERDKINIVFFSTKEEAEKYSKFFLDLSPFDENKNNFNFFYINDYVPDCEIYNDVALLCYNKEMIKKASSCPNDYIVVVKDQPKEIRSSSYMNVMSINSNHPESVFAHEFGHAFVVLAEEYVPAEIPKQSKNCVDDCEKFSNNNEGCFQGCSKNDFFRSIDSGIMRTLSSKSYGIFNEKTISDKITSETKEQQKITGQAVSNDINCEDEKYLLVKGSYNENQVQLIDKSVESGCAGKNGEGNLEYNLALKDNSIISDGKFNPEIIFTDAPGKEPTAQINGEILNNKGEFFLKLPLESESKKLEISKDKEILTEINLIGLNSRPCKI